MTWAVTPQPVLSRTATTLPPTVLQRQFIPTTILNFGHEALAVVLRTRKRSVFDQIIVDIRIPVTAMPHCFSAIICPDCPPFVGNFGRRTPKSKIQRTTTLTRYARSAIVCVVAASCV
jgi:hypothetical protein